MQHRTHTGPEFPGPITLDTLEELFAHHRRQFGGWHMGPDGDGDGDGAGDSNDGDGDSDGDGADGGGDGDGDGDGSDDLGDKGKQALDRMKTQRNAARDQLREFKALGLTPAQLKALQKPPAKDGDGDGGPTADEIREQVRAEERAAGLRERISDKIEVKAAKLFADADDAVAILLRKHDPDDFLDGDKIDVEAIQDALDELLEKKPHLAAAQGDGKRFKGTPDGGTRKAARPGQLTRDDLSRMSPQEITKARADGRLADLLSGKK